MSDIFLGEIRMFGFNFAPVQWALCNGALLPVRQSVRPTNAKQILFTMPSPKRDDISDQ